MADYQNTYKSNIFDEKTVLQLTLVTFVNFQIYEMQNCKVKTQDSKKGT